MLTKLHLQKDFEQQERSKKAQEQREAEEIKKQEQKDVQRALVVLDGELDSLLLQLNREGHKEVVLHAHHCADKSDNQIWNVDFKLGFHPNMEKEATKVLIAKLKECGFKVSAHRERIFINWK